MNTNTFKHSFLAAFCLLWLCFIPKNVSAQESPKVLGSITYFEGRVKVSNVKDSDWTQVKLKQDLFDNQVIKTSFESAVEIKWVNGSKTSIGARSKQTVASLYKNSTKNVKSKTESIWGNFLALFSTKSAESQEEGGIRRSQVMVEDSGQPDEFALEEELSFEECSKLYEEKSYLKAANAFSTFLSQQPMHPKAKYALFARGHCYIELNNLEMARESFETFIIKYPNHDLAKSANEILEKL
jgi:tetratricopeptide (TPR) repeat protein